jgi:hypothetical protein
MGEDKTLIMEHFISSAPLRLSVVRSANGTSLCRSCVGFLSFLG